MLITGVKRRFSEAAVTFETSAIVNIFNNMKRNKMSVKKEILASNKHQAITLTLILKMGKNNCKKLWGKKE